MIFNKNQDEEATISVLMDILPRMTGENEHNAICFAIECLRERQKTCQNEVI